MGKIHPKLMRYPQPMVLGVITTRKRQKLLLEMGELAEEIKFMRKQIANCERKMDMASGSERDELREQRRILADKLNELAGRFKVLEDEQTME